MHMLNMFLLNNGKVELEMYVLWGKGGAGRVGGTAVRRIFIPLWESSQPMWPSQLGNGGKPSQLVAEQPSREAWSVREMRVGPESRELEQSRWAVRSVRAEGKRGPGSASWG